ncbi:protein smoothened [Ditylenchus destructor]|uniref:Protein smoothened n=1 Tax=Ditylenchus destructor TaxID=166010 RepID=A0AAD4R1H1_9BILA|nr:protein smoothened [Ditylenchus destructor]
MMYLLLVFAVILLDADGIASSDNFTGTFLQDAEEQDMTRHNGRYVHSNLQSQKIIGIYNKYSATHWEHNDQCRVILPQHEKSTCRAANKFCFGTAVKYSFTASRSMPALPKQFEILSRFPRCWSQLGPMLCANYYRPCQLKVLNFNERAKDMARAEVNETLVSPIPFELWEVFPTTFCTHAKQECGFLVKMDLWPDFLNCEDTIESMKLLKPMNDTTEVLKPYNKECKVNYREAPIKAKMHQCMWPLVNKSSINFIVNAQPLIDDCYLPCRSHLYSDHRRPIPYFLAALGLMLCSMEWIFLGWFSKIYEDHFSVFLLSNALFSGLVYYAMLTLPYFDAIFESTVCTDSGRIRLSLHKVKLSKAGGALSLCTFSSWLITVSFISMSAWVAAFLIHQILDTHSQGQDDEFPTKTVEGDRNPRINSSTYCQFHQLSIYLFASFYATFFSFLIDIPTDGQLGICHYGVGDISRIFIVYGPVYLMAFSVLVAYIGKQVWFGWKYHTRSNANLLRRRSKQSNGFEESIALPSRTDHEKPLVDPDDTDYQDANKQTQNIFFSAFFRCMAAAYFLSIFLSAVSQSLLFWERKPEYEAVLDSIRCSLNRTLFPPQPDNSWISDSWKNDGFATSTVPYRRESLINSNLFPPGCDLEPGPGSGHLFLYIFLYPALPILVVMLWFFIGWFFKTEYTEQLFVIRGNIIPCTRDKTNDHVDLESSHGSTPQLSIKRSESQTEHYHNCAPQHYSQQQTVNQHSHYQQPPAPHYYYDQYSGIPLHRCGSCGSFSQVQSYGLMPRSASNGNINLNVRAQPSEPSVQSDPTGNLKKHLRTDMHSRYYHQETIQAGGGARTNQQIPRAMTNFNPSYWPQSAQYAHNHQCPYHHAPVGSAADGISLNSMGTFNMTSASGPAQGLDPNNVIDLIHAAGFRHGALMAQQKWAEINNQLTQYLQLAAEKLKEYQEQKQANARPPTPSSSSDVEDSEASSTRYSDIYNSDEPGSEEERFFNEQVKTMRQQTQTKSEQVSKSADQPTGTNDAGPSTK